jgi:hypothetical protein
MSIVGCFIQAAPHCTASFVSHDGNLVSSLPDFAGGSIRLAAAL